MDFAKQLGKKVRALRLDRGMTQAQLASVAKVGANYVPRLERGEMVPSVENTCRIARALGVTVDELCGRASSGVENQDMTSVLRRLRRSDIEAMERVVRALAKVKSGGGSRKPKRSRGKIER